MSEGAIWLRFVAAVLAVWRVSHLLANEDGPADLIVSLRRRLGAGLVGQLMDCFYCLSVWVGAAAALFVTRDPVQWIVTSLALSGAACLLERATSPRESAASSQGNFEGEIQHVLWTETGRAEELGHHTTGSAAPGSAAPAGVSVP